ncbi:MAG: DUF6428 family protein [Balneolaceae bacterium]
MKTSELLNTINENNRLLNFQLPDGEMIVGDLHITEVKNIHVDSTDCGGFKHSFEETVIQLWLNEESNEVEHWSTSKARNIFDIVGEQRDYLYDSDVFIEFGDSKHLTSKYAIEFSGNEDSLTIHLKNLYPQCKPKNNMENACC